MKKRKLVIVCLLGLLGCGANQNTIRETKPAMSENTLDVDVEKPKQDSIFHFECDSIKRSVSSQNFNKAYFPVDIRRCLVEKSFYGDIEAERQLATIIRVAGIDGFGLFGWNIGKIKFRGPIVFEAMLEIVNNHEIGRDFNGDIDVVTKGADKFGYCLMMISSIDGMDFETYSYNVYKQALAIDSGLQQKLLNEVNRSKFNYNILKDAWESGKIILKDYGEE